MRGLFLFFNAPIEKKGIDIMEQKRIDLKKLCVMAMFAAISVGLAYLIHIPFPPAPFLEYDPADVTILIIAFLYGPLEGLIMTLVVSAIQAMTVSAQSGIIGFAMHFFATGAMALTAGLIYKRKRTRKQAVIALGCGALVMTLVMIPLNLIFTPLYGTPLEVVKQMMLPAIVPFNAIKAVGNSILTFFVYKQISVILKIDRESPLSTNNKM